MANNNSILSSTKKLLGVAEEYDVFDIDILTHINAAISTLHQLGIGPEAGLYVEDDSSTWSELLGTDPRLNIARTYIYQKVRLGFDPPATSFGIKAIQDQISEAEWRLSVIHDSLVSSSSDEDEVVWVQDDPNGLPVELEVGSIGYDPVTGNVWRKV